MLMLVTTFLHTSAARFDKITLIFNKCIFIISLTGFIAVSEVETVQKLKRGYTTILLDNLKAVRCTNN